MRKEFELNGCVEVQPEVTEDEFLDALITFVESRGWYFGGGVREIQDGSCVDIDEKKEKKLEEE